MSFAKVLFSGLVGAVAVNLLNETARQFVQDAPRLDILGKRAIAYPLMEAGKEPPPNSQLYWIALGGDIITNSLYYSIVGFGDVKNAYRTGALLGLAAGVGAVVLPERIGLGEEMTARENSTKAMTVTWYLAGGLAAAATYQVLSDD
jgi:prepilin signal peptidase PulO-like enzyme (type II secretory pathway)